METIEIVFQYSSGNFNEHRAAVHRLCGCDKPWFLRTRTHNNGPPM